MSEVILPDHVQTALDQVVKDEGFHNHTIAVKDGAFAGFGFMSEILAVTISEESENHRKELHLLCKVPPLNEMRRKAFFNDLMFGREFFFYNKVLPHFIDFQREKNVPKEDQFKAYPKCYAAIGNISNENIAFVMADLRSEGFKMWDKTKPTTIDNIRLVLREIGIFHAISFSMKHQRPDEFARYKDLADLSRQMFKSDILRGIVKSYFNRTVEALHNAERKEIMTKLNEKTLEYFESCLNEEASNKFGVVAHGDLWNNNIMYRFDANNIAEDVRFVDWQVIRYVSPAIDLCNHIFTSTDKALRDKEYLNLLKHYHNSLSRTIRLLGSDPEELFTFDNLLDEMKKCGTYALLVAPMHIHIAAVGESQKVEVNESYDEKDGPSSVNAEDEYERKLNDVIGDIVDLGYFNEVK